MKKTIQIRLVGVDARLRHTIEYAFSSVPKCHFKITQGWEGADILLVDADQLEGKQYLREVEIAHPIVVMSVMDDVVKHLEASTSHTVRSIKKPLQTKQLFAALSEASELKDDLLKIPPKPFSRFATHPNHTSQSFSKIFESAEPKDLRHSPAHQNMVPVSESTTSIEKSVSAGSSFVKIDHYSDLKMDNFITPAVSNLEKVSAKGDTQPQAHSSDLRRSVSADLPPLNPRLNTELGNKTDDVLVQLVQRLHELAGNIVLKTIADEPTDQAVVSLELDKQTALQNDLDLIQPVKNSVQDSVAERSTYAVSPLTQAEPVLVRHKDLKISTEQKELIQKDKPIVDESSLEQMKKIGLSRLCGYAQDYDLNDIDNLDKIYFDFDRYICASFREALSEADKFSKVVQFNLDGSVLVLSPIDERVYTTITDVHLRVLALTPLDRPIPYRLISHPEDAFYENEQIKNDFLAMFLSRVVLWSARGRLPRNTPLDQPIRLLQIPNISSVMPIPGATKISDLWQSQSDISLLETIQRVHLPQRYVFSFYCVCYLLGWAKL